MEWSCYLSNDLVRCAVGLTSTTGLVDVVRWRHVWLQLNLNAKAVRVSGQAATILACDDVDVAWFLRLQASHPRQPLTARSD